MEVGKEITLIGSHNCQLQAYIHQNPEPVQPESGKLGIILFHPYAHLGGCCNDPIVLSIFRLAAASPAVHTVVRYNQRGVGSSAGSKSIWGDADMADAMAVCQQVLTLPEAPQFLHLIGYSWGACLAAHAAQLATVQAYVGISPVTGRLASMFLRTKRHLSKLVSKPALPKLFVAGDHDQFSSTASLYETAHALAQQGGCRHQTNKTAGNEPTECSTVVRILPGCDHFHVHQRRELALCVIRFCLGS